MPLQSLSLSQQQRQMMVLAPQLRQSLEMLQLPMLELRAMIQKEMEQNPTIEEVVSPHEISFDTLARQRKDGSKDESPPEEKKTTEEAQLSDEHIDRLAAMDAEWRDYYFDESQNTPYTVQDEERRRYMFESLQQPESLQKHLLMQLEMTDLPPDDKRVGELIIGSIDDNGYLDSTILEMSIQSGAIIDRVHRILSVIQEFDPPGIAARDLRESLLIQLRQSAAPEASLAETIVANHLENIGAERYRQIANSLKVDIEAVEKAAKLIRSLNPQPGRLFEPENQSYITPEIFIRRDKNGRWTVILDDDHLPHIRISAHYRRLLEDPDTAPEVKSYIRDRIRSGAFLIKSIHQRQRTIHMIASDIVDSQQGFLENGVSELRPMTMAEVAERVGVHETTVSRTVANKYIKTPAGIFELKYFFTPGLKTSDGETVSNKTVQDRINSIINDEDPSSPLSDQAIQEILQGEGVEIARRTVAKYRKILRIPPSHQRKRG